MDKPFGAKIEEVGRRSFQPPHLGNRLALAIIAGVLLLFVLMTSYYTVEPESRGVVLRFGRFSSISEPGLHFKIPFGVDLVQIVPVERQLKEEFGFRTIEAGVKTQYDPNEYPLESLMVTGDLNSASVEWSVQYRIKDPQEYLFKVRDSVKTLRDASEAVMRKVVGDHTIDEVLTVGRQEIEYDAQLRLQKLVDTYNMGISIDRLILQGVKPPDPQVKEAFDDVNKAQQELESMVNGAWADYNASVPKATGEAQQQIQEAEGYALQRVNRSEGDAASFNAVFAQYSKAPEVTRRRIYLETMSEVIGKIGQKYVIDDQMKGVLPLLQLKPEEAAK